MTRRSLWRPKLTALAVGLVVLTVPARTSAQTVAAADDTSAAQSGKKKAASLVSFKWGEHPSLRIGKMFRFDFTGRVQRGATRSEAPIDEGANSSLDIARERIGVDGAVKNFLTFQLERELRDKHNDPWRDVFVDITQIKALQVQAGKFKLPFGLDENTGATNLDFAYRSLASSQLAPGRDRGVMLHGQLAGRMFDYAAGVFEHDGKNAQTDNPDRVTGGSTGAVRLLVHPFGTASAFEDLRLGVAATSSWVGEGKSSLKGHTVLGSDMYQAEALVKGRRDRLGLELRLRKGPAALRAEYIRIAEQRLGEGIDDDDLPAVVSQGWYVSGTWALTGETKSKGLDRPLHPLLHGGVGAVELAARVEEIAYGSDPDAENASTSPRSIVVQGNRDRVVTLGVNWYPIRCVKVQGDALREQLVDPSVGPLPSRPAFWSGVIRIQVGF